MRLEEVVHRPVALLHHIMDPILDGGGKVERLGNQNLVAVSFVKAEFGFGPHLRANAGHELIAIKSFPGGSIEDDHLAGLKLARGGDGACFNAKNTRFGCYVEPTPLIGTPSNRP